MRKVRLCGLIVLLLVTKEVQVILMMDMGSHCDLPVCGSDGSTQSRRVDAETTARAPNGDEGF